MEGEGDFVIAIPDRGFLVLEVKGDYISVRDGRWFQNSKPLEHSPREQAHSFAKKLVSRLPSVHGYTVPYGILDKIILECSQFLECNRVAVLRLVKGRFAVRMRDALSRVLVV
jgi:hypothetical protein